MINQVEIIKWYNEHKRHVNKIIKEEKHEYKPIGSDFFKPELWKAAHWIWFFRNEVK